MLRDCLTDQKFLVLRGTPATIDEEIDPDVLGISCSLAQGTEQIGGELGYTRHLVIKNRRAVGNDTVSLAKRTRPVNEKGRRAVGNDTVSLAKRTRAVSAKGRRAVADDTVSLAKRTMALSAKDGG